MLITSLNNDKIKSITKLYQKKYRDQEQKFIVEGDHLVNEAYKSNNLLEVYALEGTSYYFDNIDIIYVTKEVMKKLSDQVSSTDIIGIVKYQNYQNLSGNLVLLDAIQDPGNLGTIIRSAAAFNYSVVFISLLFYLFYKHKNIIKLKNNK